MRKIGKISLNIRSGLSKKAFDSYNSSLFFLNICPKFYSCFCSVSLTKLIGTMAIDTNSMSHNFSSNHPFCDPEARLNSKEEC